VLYQKGGAVYAEIQDQPRAWKQLLTESASHKDAFVTWLRSENFGQVLLIGSSDCYGVALSAASIMHLVSGLNTIARPSAEVLYLRRPPYDSRIKTLVLALSVDGDDPDTVWAVEKMKKLHPACKVLFIGCEEGQLAAMADHKLLAQGIMEETPIRSRTVSCLLLYTMILTVWISGKDVFLNELMKCSEALDFQKIQDQLRSVSGVKPQPVHITYLGSGPYAGVALHGSIKMKQMAAIGASSESSLEYRHGHHFALTNMSMTCSMVSDTFREAELQVAYNLATTRAQRVLVVEKLDPKEAIRVEHSVELQCGLSEISRVLLMYPVVQLMAFYVALAKGVNPDKPREGVKEIVLENKPGV